MQCCGFMNRFSFTVYSTDPGWEASGPWPLCSSEIELNGDGSTDFMVRGLPL